MHQGKYIGRVFVPILELPVKSPPRDEVKGAGAGRTEYDRRSPATETASFIGTHCMEKWDNALERSGLRGECP
jgi:hypothetical protein